MALPPSPAARRAAKMSKLRILVLTSSTGGGHDARAEAFAEWCFQLYRHDVDVRIEQMLENMFVGRPPGNYDRLLDFSFAKTGNLFFVPSATFLENVGDDT